MTFEHTLRVRFHQSDPAGVLFYGRVFELVQATYEDLCRAAGIDIDALLQQHVYTTPVVHVEVDYRAPIVVGEEVVVRAVVERLGTASITIAYTLLGRTGDVRATVRVVHVYVDAKTWQATPIPDDLRGRLARFRAAE